jgi:HlyD family secretion protein
MAKKNNTKRTIWILVGILALVSVIAVIKSKNRQIGKDVETEEVIRRTIVETVSASGRIFPETEVKISSDVSGEIVELYVEEGDSVVTGQIIARIDPDNYLSAVERGKANVDASKSQLAISRAQIESSKAQMEQIKAQLENAQSIHKRNEKLRKEGVISDLEFEQSLSNLRSLEANLRASQASIRSAEQNEQASAFSVKNAEAGLKELQTNLRRTTITAPTSGIVSSLSVEKGERVVGTIQMAGTEMLRISNLNTMEVQVEVSESDIPKISIGDEVEIKVDAYLNRKFRGTVTKIANSASNINALGNQGLNLNQVTNFTIKIRIEQDSYKDLIRPGNKYPFRPGMTASVDIFTSKAENVLAVPIQSVTVREKSTVESKKKKERLTSDDFEEVVFIAEADTLRKTAVVTGIQDDEYIEIKEGVTEGLKVVAGPYSEISTGLKGGEKVNPKKLEKKKE